MKLAVIMDSRFYRTPDGYVTFSNVRGPYWKEFANHWDKIYLFVRSWPIGDQQYDQSDVINDSKIEVVELPAYAGLWGFLKNRRKIRNTISAHIDRVDVINSRGPGQLSGLAVRYFASQRPTMVTILGDIEGMFLSERSSYRYFPFLWPLRKWVARGIAYRYRRLLRSAACIIGVSTYLMHKYRSSQNQLAGQIADTKLRPKDFIPPRPRQGPLKGITAGRIWELKNYQTIIRGIARAREKGHDCYFRFCGDGYYRETLETLTQKLGVEDLIDFFGRTESQDELWRLYGEADYSCLVSHTEGLPLAAIEAMATGLPVIIADLPYADDLIQDAEQGYRIGLNDADALADHLVKFASDESLRYTMARKAFDKAQKLTIAEQARNFAELAKQAAAQ